MTTQDSRNKISGIDKPFVSLDAVTATGAGADKVFPMPANIVSMQVSFTGSPSAVKIRLEGTIDGVNWFTLTSFNTSPSGVTGDIVTSVNTVVMGIRAYLETLTAGTNPTVTASILANRGS